MAKFTVPNYLMDPIYPCLIRNPVTTNTPDKTTFEYDVITKHLKTSATNPMNRLPLTIADLIPNSEFKIKVDKFLRENNICSFEQFMAAVKSGDLATLQQLNFIDDYLHSTDSNGDTPLLIAIQRGNETSVTFLLNQGATDRHNEKTGNYPLHVAVLNDQVKLIPILIRHKCNPTSINNDGLQPCHMAIKRRSLNLVRSLLDAVNHSEIRESMLQATTKEGGNSLLLLSVKYQHFESVEYFLLSEGLNPYQTNNAKQNAFTLAKINHDKNDATQQTKDIYQLIINNRLLFAAVSLNVDLVIQLRLQGHSIKSCSANAPVIFKTNSEGRTKLHEAVSQDKADLVEPLLQLGANPHSLDRNAVTPFQLAKSEEIEDPVTQQKLSKPSAVKSLLIQYGSFKVVPDHFICPVSQQIMQDPVKAADGKIYDRQAIRQIWESSKVFISPITKKILTDLTLEPQETLQQEIQDFIKTHPIANINDFVNCVLNSNIRKLATLYIIPVYLNLPLFNNIPIWVWAIQQKNIDLLSMLVEYFEYSPILKLNFIFFNNHFCSILHLAALFGDVQMTNLLLNKGVSSQEVQIGGNTPLERSTGILPVHLAAQKGKRQVVEVLLKRTSPAIDAQQNKDKKTALHLASEGKHTSTIELLKENDANPLIPDIHNNIPLNNKLVLISYCKSPTSCNHLLKCMKDDPTFINRIKSGSFFETMPELDFSSPLINLSLACKEAYSSTLIAFIKNSGYIHLLTPSELLLPVSKGRLTGLTLLYCLSKTEDGCIFIGELLTGNINNAASLFSSRDKLIKITKIICTELSQEFHLETTLLVMLSFEQGRILFSKILGEDSTILAYIPSGIFFKTIRTGPHKGQSPFSILLMKDMALLERILRQSSHLLLAISQLLLCNPIDASSPLSPLHRLMIVNLPLLELIVQNNEQLLKDFTNNDLNTVLTTGPLAGISVWGFLAKSTIGNRIMRKIVQVNPLHKDLPLPKDEIIQTLPHAQPQHEQRLSLSALPPVTIPAVPPSIPVADRTSPSNHLTRHRHLVPRNIDYIESIRPFVTNVNINIFAKNLLGEALFSKISCDGRFTNYPLSLQILAAHDQFKEMYHLIVQTIKSNEASPEDKQRAKEIAERIYIFFTMIQKIHANKDDATSFQQIMNQIQECVIDFQEHTQQLGIGGTLIVSICTVLSAILFGVLGAIGGFVAGAAIGGTLGTALVPIGGTISGATVVGIVGATKTAVAAGGAGAITGSAIGTSLAGILGGWGFAELSRFCYFKYSNDPFNQQVKNITESLDNTFNTISSLPSI